MGEYAIPYLIEWWDNWNKVTRYDYATLTGLADVVAEHRHDKPVVWDIRVNPPIEVKGVTDEAVELGALLKRLGTL